MFSIPWNPDTIALVARFLRKHPRYAPGFCRKPLADAIDRVIYDL